MPALPSASACPLRDWGPPEGQPTPTKETQRSKRPSSQQVLTGRGPWLAEGGGLRTGLRSDPLWVRGLGKIISVSHPRGRREGLEGACRCWGQVSRKEGRGQ